jgi:O-antigen ligase
MNDTAASTPLRPVISWTLIGCVVVAIAPWLTGGQEPLALLLSAGALLLGSLLLWRQPGVRRLRRGPLVWSYLGLLGWATLSLLWTANRYSSALWIVALVAGGLVFRLAYTLAGEEASRRRLAGAYLVSAGLFAGYGVWLYLTDAYDRLTGSFYWANPAAAYLIPAVLLCLHGLRTGGRARWAWVGLSLLFGSAFLLADSRAATLVLLLVAGVYLAVQKQARNYWITLVFVLAGSWVMAQGVMQLRQIIQPNVNSTTPGGRFAEAVSGDSRSGSDRLEYLRSAGEMWWQHPLQGVGAGAYADVHPQYQRRVVSASTNAHNFYVQTVAELGLTGAILLAWLLVSLGLGLLRGLWLQPAAGFPAVAVTLGLVGVLMHSGLDIDLRYPAFWGLTAVLAGLVYAQIRSGLAPVSWRLPALAVLMLVPVISLYQGGSWQQRAQVAQADDDYVLAAEQYGRAHEGLVANPDWINAEGINLYVLALSQPQATRRRRLADQAVDRARQAQAADPADAQHHQLEGRARQLMGDAAGAEAAYRRALRLDPLNHPEYAWDLGLLLKQQGRAGEARVVAQAMLACYPDEVVNNRGNDRTVRPMVANLWALVGNIELEHGHIDQARRSAARALTIDRQSVRGRALKHQLDQR